MSKSQRALANYILNNLDSAVFCTAYQLGRICSVSESTAVRFASFLGYRGFPELTHAMEELVHHKISVINKETVTIGRINDEGLLASVINSDIEKLQATFSAIDENAFTAAVNTILSARKIYIIGVRSCAGLAQFLNFNLSMIFENVVNVSTCLSSEVFEQLMHIGSEDVLIGISFPRYSMVTLKALEFANNRQASVITLTDSIHSPMNMYSSCNLITPSTMSNVTDSLVAPMSVINALVLALCREKRTHVSETLKELEKIWDNYQVTGSDEINLVSDSVHMDFKDKD